MNKTQQTPKNKAWFIAVGLALFACTWHSSAEAQSLNPSPVGIPMASIGASWVPALQAPHLGRARGLRLRQEAKAGVAGPILKQQGFHCLGVEDGLEFVIFLPVAITAAILGAVLITGNILALRSRAGQIGWGVGALILGLASSIAAGVLTSIGSQGFDARCSHMTALAVISIIMMGGTAVLGIVNIVLGMKKAREDAIKQTSLMITPWLSPTRASGLQGGMALVGTF